MKEIDWSTAPEDATHFQPAYSYLDNPVFWRIENGVAREVWIVGSLGRGIKDHFTYGPEGNDCYIREQCIERPKQVWNGEGLPPVGTICEWFSYEYGWLGGKVVGHDNDVTIVRHNDGYEGCHSHRIRPIKIQEQLAAEEREKAIHEMYGKTLAHAGDYESKIQRKVCESLYDAGYRLTKTEE